MLNLSKQTSCGRFIVTIRSDVPGTDLMLVSDVARSLKELSDILSEASMLALRHAVEMLERPPADAAQGEQ